MADVYVLLLPAWDISSAETDRELAGDTGTMARHRRLCRELDFVTRHRFKSVDAISDYRAAIAGRAKAMRAERTECTRQLRRKSCHPSQADTLEMRRSELTAGLKEMRCEDALAASVIERIERTRKSRSLMHEQGTPVPQRGKSCVRSQMER